MDSSAVCAHCGAAGSPGRKYCTSCGSPLGHFCKTCGAMGSPDDHYCGVCGTVLAEGVRDAKRRNPLRGLEATTVVKQYSVEEVEELLLLRRAMNCTAASAETLGQNDIDDLFRQP